ncbi:MAG: DUF4271 domain-containing protein [Bacteroidales bacterium]
MIPPRTVGKSRADTLSLTVADTAGVIRADSLPVIAADTVPVSDDDMIPVTATDTVPPAEPGSLIVSPPLPPAVDIEDSIISADEEVETIGKAVMAETESPFENAVPLTAAVKSNGYDAAWYLDSADAPFMQEYVFAGRVADPVKKEFSRRVFIEQDNSELNDAGENYTEYLKEEVTEYGNHQADYSTAWIPALVILSFLLLTWIKLIYIQFITPVLVSAFNFREAAKLYHEKNAPAQNMFLILHIIFAINGGLFFLFVADYFDLRLPDINPVLIFLSASAILVMIFALKSFFISVIGFLFDQSSLFSEYKHNISLYNKIFGILLLPVIVGLLYGGDFFHGPFIYGGMALAAVFYLLQFVRGMEIIVKKEFSLFYLILYLCAFEIFPILVLYKLFQVLLV